MKAFVPTIVMALIALIASGLAYYYYPKQLAEVVENRVDQPLFPDSYETRQVRSIRIVGFDKAQGAIERLQLGLVGGSWVIPDKSNFLATNAERISTAVSSLKNCIVLEMVSDQQKDHEKYGVIEPGAATTSATGIGTKIVLEDRNQRPLAELIVGEPTRDADKRFVRIPGQPQIYVVNFDESILDTDFSSWIVGDLLKLSTAQVPLDNLDLESYLIPTQQLTSVSLDQLTKNYGYRAVVKKDAEQFLVDLWQPTDGQQLPEEPGVVGQGVDMQSLGGVIRQLSSFDILDVKKKNEEAAQHMAKPQPDDAIEHFSSLAADGFRRVGFENGQHQFDAVGGELKMAFADGVVYRIYFGNLAGIDVTDRSKISRFMLITAELNESAIPMPKKPGSDAAGESETSADSQSRSAATTNGENQEPEKQDSGDNEQEKQQEPAEPAQQVDDEQQREYQRQLNTREQIINVARQRVSIINQLHADWLYVVSENAIRNLFPEPDKLAAPAGR